MVSFSLRHKVIDVALEEEMRHEVVRLEIELKRIDEQLAKMYAKTSVLLNTRQKAEHDLKTLIESVEETYIRKQEEESLAKIIGNKKIKI